MAIPSRARTLGAVLGLLLTSAPARAESRTAPRSAATRLTVMTYNIQHGEGADRRVDLARTAAALRGADIAGLCEVDRNMWRTGLVHQAEVLGRILGMTYTFGANLRGWLVQGYGNALLSRFPILASRNHPLPGAAGAEPRGLLRAVLSVPGWGDPPLHVFVTHLSRRPRLRIRQARAVRSLLSTVSGPHILLGDLNDVPTSRTLAALTASGRGAMRDAWTQATMRRTREAHGATAPSRRPRRRIDYVLLSRDLHAASANVPVTLASDHQPVRVAVTRLLGGPLR